MALVLQQLVQLTMAAAGGAETRILAKVVVVTAVGTRQEAGAGAQQAAMAGAAADLQQTGETGAGHQIMASTVDNHKVSVLISSSLGEPDHDLLLQQQDLLVGFLELLCCCDCECF
jgi:hypothetical protein